jgi:predicted O-linked N-acetylglucosamine transferase (SPINDLY family)
MLRHEVKARFQSLIAPWEAESLGIPPGIILSVARSYARKFKLRQFVTLDETNDRRRIILFVSADLGDHPTAHLMSAELMEMRKSERAEVWLLCVATQDRLADLNSSSSRYRTELKIVYGPRFLEHGHLDDKDVTQRINDLSPHVIYLAGFHQDGDRIAVFEGVTGAVIVQAVAHASTTGSMGIHRLLCNNEVRPKDMHIWKFAPEDILGYDRMCKDM